MSVAKVTYNNEGVEEVQGGGDVQPRPGVYVARIAFAEKRDTKADGTPADDIRVGLDLGSDYAWIWSYIGLGEAAKWKLAEFTRALGMREKGSFDTDGLVDKILKVKINPDTYEGQYVGRAGRFIKAKKGEKIISYDEPSGYGDEVMAAAADEEEPDEPEGEEPEGEEEGYTPSYAKGFEPNRESDDEVGSYDDWSDDDLEEELADRNAEEFMPGGRGKRRTKIIAALRAEDEAAEGESVAATDGDQSDEYDSMDLEELIAEAKARGISLPRGRKTETQVVTLLREDDNGDPFQS
jgi:hypothetical protein